ncbi:MAG: hypothetical protein A2231_06545 [Candidatus Firestonebacteria bacterium RIFOXYA2_FULL_40_8]|nr:MAG: hypothetical protein A2231_06545 [Candidatus Firestonebacteria bacterium RIFOXYA2_FULL_40_8]
MKDIIKKNGIPSYVQVEEYLLKRILNREIMPGEQLPTERSLSESLNVSRNTISEAFKRLEKDGVIVSLQGKGTFVKDDLPVPTSSRKEDLLEAIYSVIEKSTRLGFTPEQFMTFVNASVYEYSMKSNKVNILVIDCNEEQVMFFSKYMVKFPFVSVNTVLLDELPKVKDSTLVKNADLIITTIRHEEEVRSIVRGKNILSIATAPNLEALVQIAHIAKNQKVGLICSGKRFFEIFLKTMETAGIATSNIASIGPKENISEFMTKYDNIIVTTLYEKTARNQLKMDDPRNMIVFYYEIDKGSCSIIDTKIAELKKIQK